MNPLTCEVNNTDYLITMAPVDRCIRQQVQSLLEVVVLEAVKIGNRKYLSASDRGQIIIAR